MVYFVGAGTGAVDLITVRGTRLLSQADVIIYAGSLVNPELLSYAKEECEVHNSAKLTLEEVIRIIVKSEAQGKTTVRLHTGDPSIYGAVREQMDELDERGIAYESCPGVSACFGAAASLNLEYTLPGISQSLVITRMEGKTKVPAKESIESFAAHRASMAVYLSAGMMEELEQRLLAGGYEENTPAALIYKATWDEEEAYVCTVGTLPKTAEEHHITKTALVLVGDTIAHQNYQKSRLYAVDFSTAFRTGTDAAELQQEKSCVKEAVTGKVSVISFTKQGWKLSERIAKALTKEQRTEVSLYTKCQYCTDNGLTSSEESDAGDTLSIAYVTESLTEWVKKKMQEGNAILFIGACGIAVRAVAPCLTDKLTDVPVLVMDETGGYAIPILSGHMGGANALAEYLAEITGAKAVITTATDLHGKFAVDLFAKKNGLFIENKDGIAKVSAKVLEGRKITMSIEPGHDVSVEKAEGRTGKLQEGFCESVHCGGLPREVRFVPYPPTEPVDIVISSAADDARAVLRLKPKEYIIGMGCKKGRTAAEIDAFIRKKLKELDISESEIYAFASIEQKRGEAGFVEWCQSRRIPFLTYTAQELREVEGSFRKSAFVEAQVGVDNVCERAALKASGTGGKLICKKQAADGMTVAVAKREWGIVF